MQPNSGLTSKKLKSITSVLSAVKTRKFHWNFPGNSFIELHEVFENQYKKLEKAIDEIVERINKLVAITPGTRQELPGMASLEEASCTYPSQKELIRGSLKDHESVVIHIADCDEKYGDIGTSDFLTDPIREHETIAWKLRRYLQ